MAVPPGCTRIVFGGALNGNEVWETGYWVYGNVSTSNADAATLAGITLGTLTDATSGPWNFIKALNSTLTSLKWCNVYAYVTGGTTADHIGQATITPSTGSGSVTAPNQLALVVSLLSANAGRSHRGRMYFPLTAWDNGNVSAGQVAATTVAAFATRCALHFSDWNAGSAGKIAVVSQTHTTHDLVTAVRCDGRADIQRRRANRQAAVTVSNATVTP